ncbi:hypothetical protein H109_05819 [Trichophyton interdigitale MR816]|uniref:Uncharacterized protein n=1 Tax=Trichophyton interdigitale (strain MR816) TaxID=1215338 RepID=A0A059J478_TRIIM|nr:hypothetical protein H101_03990 [Trichophyton interdigitale H6]KDB22277.1 hypothetical protein H109_05819 [Trichophyton interdigitale MR816]
MPGDVSPAFIGGRVRSTSLSFDRSASVSSKASAPSPPLVNPAPQYVAISAATQLISASHGVNPLEPKEGRPGNAIVTPPSLVLVNGFLDHILFNILLAAKSTKLAAIRPAVSDVLKPRLARAVVSVADEELSEYMGTSDEEELTGYGYSQETAGAAGQGHFELERSWKLTRLRCMVYARLGDMEEDDEEEYLQREGLSETNGRPYFMNYGGMLTPAAAIFLTSILEYIAENILIIAGENSSARLGFSDENDERKYQGGTLVVDDVDVEKVALNPTLGRLWRTWRKNLRAPALSRTLSRESLVRRGCSSRTSTHSSIGTFDTFDTFNGFSFGGRKISSADQHVSDAASVSTSTCVNVNPADIPLPISEYDIDEIEIPGFSAQLAVALPARSMRPRSLFIASPDVAARPVLARSTSAISPRVAMAAASAAASSSSAAALAPARSSARRAHIRSQSLPQPMYITSPLSPSLSRIKRSASSAADTRKEDDHLESMPEAEEPETDSKAEESAAAAAAATTTTTTTTTTTSELEQAGPDSASIYSPYHPASIASPRCQDSSMEQEVVSPPSSEMGDNNSVVSSVYTIPEASRVLSKESAAESTTSQTANSSSARITTCEDIADGNPAYYSSSSLTDEDQAARKAARRKATAAPLPPTSNPFGDNIVETSFVSRSPRSPSRGARLTPLTEVADNTPVQNERSSPDQASINSGDSEPSVTPRSRAWLTKINTNCSTRQNLPVSPGSERAAVQRVTPPPSSISRDSSKLRRSESAGSRRDGRPITSGSGVSQGSNRIRGLISRQPSDLSVSVICSSDGSGSGSTALEELLMSDETIHYTLTPRNMREMEEVGSPRWAATRPADLAADPADTSSVKSGKQSRRILSPTFRSPSISSPVPQSPLARNPPSPPPSKPKMAIPQARDARVENASVRDFANFIRSTGPDKGLHPPAAQFNSSIARAGNSSIPNSPAPTATYSTSPLATPKASKDNNKNNNSSNITSTPRASNSNRPRLEARPAVFVRDNKTSELIDFIRQGPPDPQARRLQQKTVAPFRNTMNSDDFSSFSTTIRSERDFLIGDSSIPGTQDGSMVAASVASVNSHTALIDSGTRPNSRTLQYRLSPTPNIRGDGSATPAKTRRRVRDPYAIDSDSEDEYDDVRDAAKPKEESLAEFLKNGPPPPPPPKPQPFTINIQKANELHRQKAMRPPISRSVTLDSTSEAGSPAPPRLVDLPPKYNYHGHSGRPQASLTSGSSFVATIHADQPDNQWHSGGRLPKGVIKGVDADSLYRSNKSDTAALADFLKNTGPPSSPSVSSLQSMKTGTSASWTFKTFLRKKKQVA